MLGQDPGYRNWAYQLSALNPNFSSALFQRPGDDYNYNLAYLSGIKPELNPDDQQIHLSDIGKMPNHPTFSNESAYAKIPQLGSYLPNSNTPQPGNWVGLGDEWRYHNPSRGLFWAPEQQAYNREIMPSNSEREIYRFLGR